MNKKARFQAQIGGISINSTSRAEVLRKIIERIEENRKTLVVTPNPEFIVYAQEYPWFKKILNQADFTIPDGIGLVWASRFLALSSPTEILVSASDSLAKKGRLLKRLIGARKVKPHKIWWAPRARKKGATSHSVIRERISGTDLMEKLCQEAAKRNWSVYLLGGKPGVAKKTLTVLKKRFPGLKGWAEAGPRLNLKSKILNHKSEKVVLESQAKVRQLTDDINQKSPDLLFVAFGMGKQEKFIWDNWDNLNVKLAMGVGGAFDYLSGRVPRAPKWVRKAGFEWLFRLLREPWRWRRQLALVQFVYLVLRERFGNK